MIDNYQKDGIDENIIALVKDGDHHAFLTLYDTYAAALLGVITKITGVGKIAEDVLQQAFVEIWKKKANFNGSKERLFTWMIKITLSVAMLAANTGNAVAGGQTINIRNLVYGKLMKAN